MNSTSECTTLRGWITASILLYGSRYSHLASMASNALLTSVAESIVIFGPICQVGWARASSGVTPRSAAADRETARPRRSETRRRTVVDPFPAAGTARWPSARCRPDEAIERVAAGSSSSARPGDPPATSVSLLASATRRPARSAASTAGSAAMPVVATTTMSVPSAVASSSRPPSAQRRSSRPPGARPAAQALRDGQAASCSPSPGGRRRPLGRSPGIGRGARR